MSILLQWSDDNASAPTGAWTAWDLQLIKAEEAGNAERMNEVLWVKTITTSGVGCGTAETTPVATDIINMKMVFLHLQVQVLLQIYLLEKRLPILLVLHTMDHLKDFNINGMVQVVLGLIGRHPIIR